jgi:hypothetical protein
MASGGDTTLPMAMLNANKKGVTLNLKSDRGKELLKQMASAGRRAAGEFFARHDGWSRRRV